jgi:hypothetical protein
MMCLMVVAVAEMSVVGGVSATAIEEEATMALAEEGDNRQGGWRLCHVIYFSPIFF